MHGVAELKLTSYSTPASPDLVPFRCFEVSSFTDVNLMQNANGQGYMMLLTSVVFSPKNF